jgi:homoserine acetyltransferase
MSRRIGDLLCIFLSAVFLLAPLCQAQLEQPTTGKVTPQDGDYVLRDFHFKSGETLPELRMHYLTLGKPARDASGRVTNAVLILHGTTLRPAISGAPICRRIVWTGPASGCQPILHHPA